jgi:hypothetical protein
LSFYGFGIFDRQQKKKLLLTVKSNIPKPYNSSKSFFGMKIGQMG